MKIYCLSFVLVILTNCLYAESSFFHRWHTPKPPIFKATKAPLADKIKIQPAIKSKADKVNLD